MKRCAQFFAALTVAMLSSAAEASTIVEFKAFDAHDISDNKDHHSTTMLTKGGGFETFRDSWHFFLSKPAVFLSVKLTNDFQDQGVILNILRFSNLLLSREKTFIKTIDVNNHSRVSPPPPLVSADAKFSPSLFLDPGNYHLVVRGDVGAFDGKPFPSGFEAGYRYGITLHAEPLGAVPIPAAVWLFLTALGGLGMIGYRRGQSSMEG